MKATIDFGIDLGTTNSAIAHQSGMDTELIGGPGGCLVPSVVHLGTDNLIHVGRAAIERRAQDPMNVASEFKRLIGTSERIHFPSANRSLTPVELSAEVLKELLRRAQAWNGGQRIESAVITIPAMFQLPQCEATRQAATLSGLRFAPLLQEPIAAAIASVNSADLRDGYWLVYDFGGGTFDISLVRSRNGRLQVLDHDGDNHLGGKDFDRLLVRRAAQIIRSDGGITDFNRSQVSYAPAFERLRDEAERVRIALSGAEAAQFHAEQVVPAGDGKWISVEFPVTRAELEALIAPIIARTVNICHKILDRNGLSVSQIKRVVLVGGPTLTPCLPEMLETDLGIEARHYTDPANAVAIGAAIYASTQQTPKEMRRAGVGSGLSLNLSYEAMTNDARPVVAGQLEGPQQLLAGIWHVKVVSRPERFTSEWIALRPDGSFALRAVLLPNVMNAFDMLVQHNGKAVAELAGTFSIIHGTTIAKPVLSQSVGVALADNSVRWYLRKGAVLPARHKASHATTVGLRRGQSGTTVGVPLVQGESDLADRNIVVGLIEIRAENIQQDLAVGSEVVVELSVDEHSTTRAEAYVPLLDRKFEQVAKFGLETRSAQEIRRDVTGQRERLAELNRMAAELEQSQDGGIDSRVLAIEELLEEGGADERHQADRLLKGLTGMIDSWQVRDQERHLREQFADSHAQIAQLLDPKDQERGRRYVALAAEFNAALARADLHLAETKFKSVKELEWALLREQPQFWIAFFNHLSEEALKGPHAAEARIPIDQGKVAVNANDLQALVHAAMSLIRLLPRTEQAELPLIIKSQIA